MLKQPNFFQSQTSTLPKDAPAKFYLSTTFGLRLMISYVAPTRLSTFYAYLITQIRNRNLKKIFLQASSYPLFLADSMGCKRIVSFEEKKPVASLEIIIHSSVVATQPQLFLYLKCIFCFAASYKSHTFL